MPKRPFDWLPLAVAAGVFGLLLLRPVYISRLRDRMAREAPEAWEKLPTNGRFRLLIPQLLNYRYHDEAFYASSVHEILLHGRPYSPFWPHSRAMDGWVQSSLSLYAIAAVAAACGGDMNKGWIVSVALLGAAWFLLFYRVFSWWCGKREVALPLALFSVLFPDFYVWLLDVNFNFSVNRERYASVFFQNGTDIRPSFYRLPSYFLSLFALSLLFLGLWKLSCETRPRTIPALALGAAFGLMSWVHPFEFVYGMATLMLLTAAAWLWPLPGARKRNVSLAFLASLPVGAFCMTAVSRASGPAVWSGYLELLGVLHTHRPYLTSLIHPVFAGAGLWMMRRETDPKRRAAWLLLSAAQIAIFLCRNMQVALGYTVQPFHFIPLGSFMGCVMLFLCASKKLAGVPAWNRAAGLSLSLGLVLLALGNEKAGAESTYRLFGMPRATDAALDWARDSIPADATVLSLSMMANESIPLYTKATVFISPLGLTTTPFTLDAHLAQIARLLKSCRADPERFIAARWVPPEVRRDLQARLSYQQRVLGESDQSLLEPAEWFYSFHRDYNDDDATRRNQRRLVEMTERAEPLQGPYYLWVDADDAPLLRQAPESYGGTRVFSDEKVAIYRFDGGKT